jgi:hypothetical protein
MKIKIILFITMMMLGCMAKSSYCQPPPPAEHGSGSNQQPGGGAPVGDGLVILITLGIAYGVKKIYHTHREEQEI